MNVNFHPKVDKIIRKLPRKESARIVKVVELFEEGGFNLTEKHLKSLERKLWELRAGRWRLLFGVIKNIAWITNIIPKSTKKTPRKAIDLALKRLETLK